MAQKVEPKFNKTYDLLLEQAGVMHGHLSNDIALFTADFPKIDAAFVTDFENAIDAADNTPSDEEVVNDQQVKTLSVIQIMKTARKRMQRLFIYADLAFEDNPLAREIFGHHLYQKHKTNQLKMLEILELAHKKAEDADYKQDLIDEGFTQLRIDELETLRVGLQDANLQQEGHKTDRPVISQTRVTNMNAVWDFMVEVNKASKVVFEDDYAKQQQYFLYPENSSGSGGDDNSSNATVSGTVTDDSTDGALSGAEVELKKGSDVFESDITDDSGNYTLANIPPDTYDLVISAAGFNENSTSGLVINANDELTIDVSLFPLGASISGTVRDVDTLDPIENASVKVYEDGDPGNFIEVFTDVNGNFTANVPISSSTNVTAECNATGYLQEQNSLTIEPDNDYPNTEFELTADV
jgi:hypothetical protein